MSGDFCDDFCDDCFDRDEVMYRQCLLRKAELTGYMETTSWLPDKLAKLNTVVQLKEAADGWVDGWLIVRVGLDLQPGYIIDSNQSTSYPRRHRKRRR